MKIINFAIFSIYAACVIPQENTEENTEETEIEIPEVKIPEVEIPEVKPPKVKTPEVKTPEVQPPQKQQFSGSRTSTPTYYFRVGSDVEGCAPVQNFDDGMSYGPCNGNQGVKYTSESKYWVAINGAKEHCGKQIRVNYQGNSLDLTVMDECPGCGADNHKIDVGLESLIELTGSKEVACSIGRLQPEVTWDFI